MHFKHILIAGAILMSAATHAASTPTEITSKMMPGWNLGNSLDAFGGETNWGNPATTRAMIDKIRSAGFKTLRVPVTWDDFTSGSTHTIAASRMSRVEEVVNYGLANGMYVIINVHHQNGWMAPTQSNQTAASYRLNRLWQQIATHFKGYDDKLIFETMNEPRVGEDWTGKAEYYAVVNALNASALETIRATGGNNASRLVMLPTYVAGPWAEQTSAMKLPADKMIAASIHAYVPYNFAMEYPGAATLSDTSVVDYVFSNLKTTFLDKGVPVVIGEWGTTNKNNQTARVSYTEYYVKRAAALGVPVIIWDNNITTVGGEAFGLFDRSSQNWVFPEIVTAIMRGASGMSSSSSSSSAASSSQASSSKSSSSSSAASSSSSVASSSSSKSSASSSSKSSSSSSAASSSSSKSSASSSSAASSSQSSSSSSSAASSSSSSASAGGVVASYSINSDWGAGYCANVRVVNQGSTAVTWHASLQAQGKLNQMWNATWSQSGNTVSLAGSGWNATLAPGAVMTSIGFCATR